MENHSNETHVNDVNDVVGEEDSFMKMYNALTYVRHLLCHIDSADDTAKQEAYELVCSTLASVSKKNFNVGTVDEQFERWKKFCQSHNTPVSRNWSCADCPVYDILRAGYRASCELIWGHLPYVDDKKEGV